MLKLIYFFDLMFLLTVKHADVMADRSGKRGKDVAELQL